MPGLQAPHSVDLQWICRGRAQLRHLQKALEIQLFCNLTLWPESTRGSALLAMVSPKDQSLIWPRDTRMSSFSMPIYLHFCTYEHPEVGKTLKKGQDDGGAREKDRRGTEGPGLVVMVGMGRGWTRLS